MTDFETINEIVATAEMPEGIMRPDVQMHPTQDDQAVLTGVRSDGTPQGYNVLTVPFSADEAACLAALETYIAAYTAGPSQ